MAIDDRDEAAVRAFAKAHAGRKVLAAGVSHVVYDVVNRLQSGRYTIRLQAPNYPNTWATVADIEMFLVPEEPPAASPTLPDRVQAAADYVARRQYRRVRFRDEADPRLWMVGPEFRGEQVTVTPVGGGQLLSWMDTFKDLHPANGIWGLCPVEWLVDVPSHDEAWARTHAGQRVRPNRQWWGTVTPIPRMTMVVGGVWQNPDLLDLNAHGEVLGYFDHVFLDVRPDQLSPPPSVLADRPTFIDLAGLPLGRRGFIALPRQLQLLPTPSAKEAPHRCPSCGSQAYVGFNVRTECTEPECGNYRAVW